MVSWRLPWRGKTDSVEAPEVGDSGLVLAARSDDEAIASSTVLDEAGFSTLDPVVLRITLVLPAAGAPDVIARCALDGYLVDPSAVQISLDSDPIPVALARVMTVDPVSVSRERARMGSIASRANGRVHGWEVLRAPEPAGDTPVTPRGSAR